MDPAGIKNPSMVFPVPVTLSITMPFPWNEFYDVLSLSLERFAISRLTNSGTAHTVSTSAEPCPLLTAALVLRTETSEGKFGTFDMLWPLAIKWWQHNRNTLSLSVHNDAILCGQPSNGFTKVRSHDVFHTPTYSTFIGRVLPPETSLTCLISRLDLLRSRSRHYFF